MGRHPYKPNGEKYEIEHMWEIHEEILRLLLMGMTPKAISKTIDVTPEHISTIRNSKIFQDQMAILKARRDDSAVDVAKRIDVLLPKAVDILDGVLSNPEEYKSSEVINVAQDALDRGGHGKITKIEGAVAHLTRQDILDMKERAKDAGRRNGTIIKFEDITDGKEKKTRTD